MLDIDNDEVIPGYRVSIHVIFELYSRFIFLCFVPTFHWRIDRLDLTITGLMSLSINMSVAEAGLIIRL